MLLAHSTLALHPCALTIMGNATAHLEAPWHPDTGALKDANLVIRTPPHEPAGHMGVRIIMYMYMYILYVRVRAHVQAQLQSSLRLQCEQLVLCSAPYRKLLDLVVFAHRNNHRFQN